jgi:hypothetical protein
MLCGFTAVMQASGFECLVFDLEDLGMMATIRVLSPDELNAPAAQ